MRNQLRALAFAGAALTSAVGVGAFRRAPVHVTSFTVHSCETGPGKDVTWGFQATTTGSSGGETWQIGMSSTNDTSGISIVDSGTGGGFDWTLESATVLYPGSSPNSQYFWVEFPVVTQGWVPLDANPLDIATCAV